MFLPLAKVGPDPSARLIAVNARKPEDKASWLLLAEDWLRLAQDADRPLGRPHVEK